MEFEEDFLESVPRKGSSRISRIESKKKIKKHSPLFRVFVTVCRWISTFHSRAAEERKLYRQEGLYTVADSMAQDVKILKNSKLPVIWILAAPGSPITELMVRLCECYGWYFMSIGALLQRELALETGREDEVHHLLHRGIAVPRSFIFEFIRRQMANICSRNKFKGIMLTDYPSTLTQIREMQKYVCKPDFIVYIKFSEKLTQENLSIYLKFQVRASKVLRKLQPDVHVVSIEQSKKFKREIEKIYKTYGSIFKIADGSMTIEEVCRDIMKWIERASVIHHITPPLFVEPPLHENPRDLRNVYYEDER